MNCPRCNSTKLKAFEYKFNLTKYRCREQRCRFIFYVKDLDKEVENKIKETIKLIDEELN